MSGKDSIPGSATSQKRILREQIYGPVVLGICHDAINEIYMSRSRPTIEYTARVAMHRVYVEQIRLDGDYEKNSAMPPERPFLKTPTRSLIRRLINQIPAFDIYAARFGHRAAMVHFGCMKGKGRNAVDEHQGPNNPPDNEKGRIPLETASWDKTHQGNCSRKVGEAGIANGPREFEMAIESANPGFANRGEWLERKILRGGVWFRGIRYDSDELMKLRQRWGLSLRVAVKLDKPDASAILVREPRGKSILSVPAVSPVARVPRKDTVRNSQKQPK